MSEIVEAATRVKAALRFRAVEAKRRIVEATLPECGGTLLPLGEDASEVLEYVPARKGIRPLTFYRVL